MQTIEEIAKTLDLDPVELERESLKSFLGKELRNTEVEIYKIGNKHGVKSVLELDERLQRERKIFIDKEREDLLSWVRGSWPIPGCPG